MMPAEAEVQKCFEQTGKPPRAGMHLAQCVLLLVRQIADLSARQERAVSGDRRKRRAEIVYGTRQEVGPLLVAFLEFQVHWITTCNTSSLSACSDPISRAAFL